MPEKSENRQERSNMKQYFDYLVPSVYVTCGTFTGLGGLAEIVRDVVANNPIDFTDKLVAGLGAGLVMYGVGVLKKVELDYRQ